MEAKCFTFCDALKHKYCVDNLDDSFENIEISSNRRAQILKQQNHKERVSLTLDGCLINSAGEPNEILDTCPLIQELDISSNHISEWKDVFQILNQLAHLSFLNLSHNPLKQHIETEELDVNNLPKLQKLILNNIKLEFNTVCKLLTLFPSIHELHLSLNDFQDIPDIKKQHKRVTYLYFMQNRISWDEVEKLGVHFPNLKCLIIAENPIKEIPSESDVAKYFPCLEKLSVSSTFISDWDSLDQLKKFPLLYDVRMRNLPLWGQHRNEKERRQLIMARLPLIKILNGSKIDDSQREDAERAFIRFYKKKDNRPKRYDELVSVYGEVMDLVDVDFEKHEYVRVTLTGDIKKDIPMRLDVLQSTQEFVSYIADQYELSLSQFRLFVHEKCNGARTEMRGKFTLERYFMKDGDEIQLQRLDIKQNGYGP